MSASALQIIGPNSTGPAMKGWGIIALFATTLVACTHKYATDAVQVPQQRLDRAAAVSIIKPQPGSYGATRYPESLDSARRKAVAANVAYVFEPTILNWEDRATEWSGLPDRITVRTVIWNAKTGSEVASTLARASSKWATFGGDHPQDLLPDLMANFVDRLY